MLLPVDEVNLVEAHFDPMTAGHVDLNDAVDGVWEGTREVEAGKVLFGFCEGGHLADGHVDCLIGQPEGRTGDGVVRPEAYLRREKSALEYGSGFLFVTWTICFRPFLHSFFFTINV